MGANYQQGALFSFLFMGSPRRNPELIYSELVECIVPSFFDNAFYISSIRKRGEALQLLVNCFTIGFSNHLPMVKDDPNMIHHGHE
jgi:hypothetical protein